MFGVRFPRTKKRKRLPFGKTQNFPNCGDMKGDRVYVKGTVNQIKRVLKEAGIPVKKVRHSGFHGIVEVVYTQYKRHNSPGVFFLLEKPCRITYPR